MDKTKALEILLQEIKNLEETSKDGTDPDDEIYVEYETTKEEVDNLIDALKVAVNTLQLR